MSDPKVERLVEDLIADHERRDGILPRAHVERLFEKRELSVEQVSSVITQLSDLGISIEEENSSNGIDLTLDDDSSPNITGSTYSSESIEKQLSRVSKKLLSAQDEVDLGRKMELGRRAKTELENGITRTPEHVQLVLDAENARRKMVTANLRLVFSIAKRYIGYSDLEIDDLFQEGVAGLMRAIDKYDHNLGYKLSTYATWWIKQSITRALVNKGTTIRLPVHIHNDVVRLKKAHKLLSNLHPARRVGFFEIADELAWTIDKVHFIQGVANLTPSSIDDKISNLEDFTLADTLVSELPTPDEEMYLFGFRNSIAEAITDLTEREKTIICLRFGLLGLGDGATLEEIGRIYSVTRERIRQIEAKALEKLRLPRRADILRDFIDS